MCGFLAQFGPQPASEPREIAERLAASLAHRGQDDFQTLSEPSVRMWFWRLALVDRAASKQPMQSPDGRVTILLNGEIYNYRALRAQLIELGTRFRTEGDTEVALEAYRRWGAACFERFDGMFAICIVDAQQQRVLLARDPLGIKPLYFCRNQEALWVASEPKALFAGAAVSPVLDREALTSYFLFQTVLGTRTLFRSVQKVTPGDVFEFNLTTRELLGTRSIMPKSIELPKSYEDAKALTRKTLMESARLTFDTDLPLTFHLSGGLDSNLLVSLFRHLYPGREATCLSSLIEGEHDKEWAFIQQSAAWHGCKLDRAVIDAQTFFASLDEVTYYLDEPAGDPGVVPQFHVNKLCVPHGKIVITGHGVDEMFFGYIRNLAATVLADHGVAALDARSTRFAGLPSDTRSFFTGWESYLQGMGGPDGADATLSYFRKLCRMDPFAADAGQGKLATDMRRLALETYGEFLREAPSLGDFMFTAETRIQLPALLQMEDRASMRHTIEARVPFCNPSVVALGKTLPWSWKLHGGAPKGLIRDAFSDLLPPSVLARKEKVGRPVPLNRWLAEPAGRPYREQLETKRAMFRDLASCDLLEQANTTTKPHDRLLWGLLSLSRWMDLYQVSV